MLFQPLHNYSAIEYIYFPRPRINVLRQISNRSSGTDQYEVKTALSAWSSSQSQQAVSGFLIPTGALLEEGGRGEAHGFFVLLKNDGRVREALSLYASRIGSQTWLMLNLLKVMNHMQTHPVERRVEYGGWLGGRTKKE